MRGRASAFNFKNNNVPFANREAKLRASPASGRRPCLPIIVKWCLLLDRNLAHTAHMLQAKHLALFLEVPLGASTGKPHCLAHSAHHAASKAPCFRRHRWQQQWHRCCWQQQWHCGHHASPRRCRPQSSPRYPGHKVSSTHGLAPQRVALQPACQHWGVPQPSPQ